MQNRLQDKQELCESFLIGFTKHFAFEWNF